MENWSKVKTTDSLIGYVENKRLMNERTQETEPIDEVQEQVFSSLTRDHKINLVWHQVTNATANTYLAEMMVNASGVNVISQPGFH